MYTIYFTRHATDQHNFADGTTSLIICLWMTKQ